MEIIGSEDPFDKKKNHRNDRKSHKYPKITKDRMENIHDRSAPNNMQSEKDKYKQIDNSGPSINKTSKLPDAFLNMN
jgi:hypothetical protein